MKHPSSMVVAALMLASPSSASLRTPTSSAQKQPSRQLQPSEEQEPILDYVPQTQVTDVAALDLDQRAMEDIMVLNTPDALQEALSIYINGAHSQSFARLTLARPLDPSLEVTVPAGTLVVGQAFESADEARGTLLEPIQAGDTSLLVAYEISNSQANYVNCQVGSNPNPNVAGCFASEGTLRVGNPGDLLTLNIEYTYNVMEDNDNALTLQSLSTTAMETMYQCGPSCPHVTYEKFYNYYNNFDYGNEWVLAAFNRGQTNFANGNADFSYFDTGSRGLVESIRKGTVYMNVFMQVIQSMESSLDKCRSNWTGAVGAWDEAIAYYVGSITKMDGGDEGFFLYATAEKRCRHFATCSDDTGVASVNVEIMEMFQMGQNSIASMDCEAAAQAKIRISDLMVVPLIQSLLRDAYFVDKENIVDDRADASGATYAAAVLPFVHACNQADAQTIYNNMGIGQSEKPNFDDVKAAFERNYDCMGISCADVGGLLNPSNGEYFEEAFPCDDSTIETTAPTSEDTNVDETTESPVESCPPCNTLNTNPDLTITKSVEEQCSALVSEQIDIIPDSCECACFVDNEYIFCAEQQLVYTGSGAMLGPCEVFFAKDTEEEEVVSMSNSTTLLGTNETMTDEETTAPDMETDDLLIDAEFGGNEEPSISLATEESSAISEWSSTTTSSVCLLLGAVLPLIWSN